MKRVLRERVDYLLRERGIKTLTELHSRIQDVYPGFAWRTLSQVVNGKTSPTLSTLDAIAQGLDTTVAYLIGETENPAPELDAGQPLPEIVNWSERLRRMDPEQRALTVRAMELVLAAVEGRNAAP